MTQSINITSPVLPKTWWRRLNEVWRLVPRARRRAAHDGRRLRRWRSGFRPTLLRLRLATEGAAHASTLEGAAYRPERCTRVVCQVAFRIITTVYQQCIACLNLKITTEIKPICTYFNKIGVRQKHERSTVQSNLTKPFMNCCCPGVC